jgi:hypothetical protein
MARALGANEKLAIVFESTYGTSPVSGFVTVPFVSGDLGAMQPLLASDLLGQGNDPASPTRDVITVDGGIDVPVDTDAIGYWLKALLGAPVTTGTTPKTHTFNSGGSTRPSMTIERQNPEVPYFDLFAGVCVDAMDFEMNTSGLLKCSAKLVGQGNTPGAATAAGTPAVITSAARFGHFNGSVKRNAGVLGNVTGAKFSYSNNMDAVRTIRDDGKIAGIDPTVASLSGELTVRFSDTVLLDQAIAGGTCVLDLGWAISASQSLTFTAHQVNLSRAKRQTSGPMGIEMTVPFIASKAVSPARMLTAVLVNAVASY